MRGSKRPIKKNLTVILEIEVEYEADGADISWGICPPDDQDVDVEKLPEWMQEQIYEQLLDAEVVDGDLACSEDLRSRGDD